MSKDDEKQNRTGSELSEMIFDTIDLAKNYLNLDSYDATAVVLKISAASPDDRGITEGELSESLRFSRPTMNRIIRRLIDTGHVSAIPGTYPKRYKYSHAAVTRLYGVNEPAKREAAHRKVMDRAITALLTIYWQMTDYHSEKND